MFGGTSRPAEGARQPILDESIGSYLDIDDGQPPVEINGRSWSIAKEFLKGALICGLVILAIAGIALAIYFSVGQTVGWDHAINVVKGGFGEAIEKVRSLKDMHFSLTEGVLYIGVPVLGVSALAMIGSGVLAVGARAMKARTAARREADKERLREQGRNQVAAERRRAAGILAACAARENAAYHQGAAAVQEGRYARPTNPALQNSSEGSNNSLNNTRNDGEGDSGEVS